LATSGGARAQSAEAEALFEQGGKLMTEAKYAEACDAFEASNHIEQRAGTLIRLGECRELNHQLAAAWSAYKDALTRAKDPYKRDIGMARVAELEPKLSYLTIVVGDRKVEDLAITRNGRPLDPLVWNRPLPVDGGDYVIAAHAPGFEDWNTSITVKPEGDHASVVLPKLKALPKPATPPRKTERDGAPSIFTTKRKTAISIGSGGAIALLAGGFLGASAKSNQNDAFALCPDPQTPCTQAARADQLARSGHELAIDADVAFAVGGVAMIAAGVLWFTGAPEISTGRLAIRAHIAPGAASLFVGGRF
jgi:hypothetical protein